MADTGRRQQMVGIQTVGMDVLKKLSEKHKISMQGLVTGLVLMADSQHPELGIIDIDWPAMRKKYPNARKKQKKSWDAVLLAVEAMMSDTEDPAEMAQRSRFTINQCTRAIKELKGEIQNTHMPRRVRKNPVV